MQRYILATVLCLLAAGAQAQGAGLGAELYAQNCATCHGVNHDGNGPMAPALLVQPSDLSTLQARNGNIFPTLRVVMRIDGRDPLISHGSDMPIYGDFFEGDDTPLKTHLGQPIFTSRPIVELVAYLQSVQQ
ncbi:c-type cytochrome [Sulfitobacter sp. S190]|uniref:c-type cytochrome n=1 Tax=Sulfitobacter sp. S190 TaxID=2867022 RepID=UPI0021A61962|nr:c-type cytochrome [Sulfitobacter sp. S190]UWR21493.1 c-type cytochrome [Sulfitobacter sp. S190]